MWVSKQRERHRMTYTQYQLNNCTHPWPTKQRSSLMKITFLGSWLAGWLVRRVFGLSLCGRFVGEKPV